MKAKDLDKLFDSGEVDMTTYLDLSEGQRPDQEQKRVNVDFPMWMLRRIDRTAKRLGVPRQSLIKVWLAERLAQQSSNKSLLDVEGIDLDLSRDEIVAFIHEERSEYD